MNKVKGTKYIQKNDNEVEFNSLNIGEQFEYNDEPYIKIWLYNMQQAAFCYTTGMVSRFPFDDTTVIPKKFNIKIT